MEIEADFGARSDMSIQAECDIVPPTVLCLPPMRSLSFFSEYLQGHENILYSA